MYAYILNNDLSINYSEGLIPLDVEHEEGEIITLRGPWGIINTYEVFIKQANMMYLIRIYAC